jgi:hypothetical protein
MADNAFEAIEPLPSPDHWGRLTNQQILLGQRNDPLELIKIYDEDEWEKFTREWVEGTPPGHEEVVSIPWGKREWRPRSEYFLTVKFRLRKATPWAQAGQIVAWEQIPIPVAEGHAEAGPSVAEGAVDLTQEGKEWVMSAGKSSVRIGGANGWLQSFTSDGRQLLAARCSRLRSR